MLKITKYRKALLEQPFWTRFWGRRCKVKPFLVDKALGDGERLIAITPLNTRPHYYLIRIDSRWDFQGNDDEYDIHEHLDEIYDAIEDEFGRGGYLDKYESPTGRPRFEYWPGLNLDCGTSWSCAMDLLGLTWRERDGWEGVRLS